MTEKLRLGRKESSKTNKQVIKFHIKHQVQGKAAQGFWADWIGTVVAMAIPIDL